MGRIISGRSVSDGSGGRGTFSDVESLIKKYIGQKLHNDQVAEVVSAACTVSVDQRIILKEDLLITDDLKEICGQFNSGGIAKAGRGILDEYYTDSKIVDAVGDLIKNSFKNRNKISVLEPSVGTGNFLNVLRNLGIEASINCFEINSTTAKIAKILYPDANINLRSFETEFIDENGNRKDAKEFSKRYDLVIGNPPYGEHRGLYKGLGEEPQISKYEDYFVKRSLDSLKPDGILAMVLPSGWLNRQKQLQNANILDAFRLPSGVFAATQIGTDIIILRKSDQNLSVDISNYFTSNPEKILGEIREKSNRFGRLEKYVHGNLDEAIYKIEQFRNRNETQRIGNLFEDQFLDDTVINSVKYVSEGEEITSTAKGLSKVTNQKKSSCTTIDLQEKINEVLSRLSIIKFKSPAILKEIEKYQKLQFQTNAEPLSYNAKSIEEIFLKRKRFSNFKRKKIQNINSRQNRKSEKEY